MSYQVVLLPGDGIGPEIVDEAVRVLEAVTGHSGEIEFSTQLLGGRAIDETGEPFPEVTRKAVLAADAVLLGAVGGPKWDKGPGHLRPEGGLLALRKALGVYANIRPVKAFKELIDASPLKPELAGAVDLLIVRELTGGVYFGERERGVSDSGERFARDTMLYTESEIKRVVRRGFEIAQGRNKRLASVDKANVLDSSRLWRELVEEMKNEYPDVQVEHVLVDACAMYLVTKPQHFDVVVTENLFGDILSDEAAVLTGSIGLLPSASLGDQSGLYEPIHGSAPDIAGLGIANPVGTILSAAMLLRYSLHMPNEAERIEHAVAVALADGARTKDIARAGEAVLTTKAMTEAVLAHL